MTGTAADRVEDPAVPGCGLLLDDPSLREWLAGHDQQLLERRYVRYKPGTSCVVGLRLRSGWAFALATSAAALPKLTKLAEQAPAGGVLALDPGRRVLLATAGADRDLPALRDLQRAASRAMPVPGPYEVSTLVHKPQRRWVGLLETSPGSAPVLLRAYRPQRAADAARRLKLARRVADAVEVPRLLGRSSRWAVLAVQYVPGQTLADALEHGPAREDVVATGEALAAVHGIRPDAMPETDLAAPAATVALVGALLPHLRRRTLDLAARLDATRPPAPELTVCHGDFSLDQVVIGPAGRPAFVDWDRGGAGAPAADLGSVAASGVDGATLEALHEGYAKVRAVPARLDWYTAQARLLRMADPFRTAQPGWSAAVEARVTDLERDWS